MAPRRSNDDATRALRLQVVELESRVRWLERKLKKVAAAAKPRPPPTPPAPNRRRCPGCLADLPPRQRAKTCVYCGFDFQAVAPFRPRSRQL